MKLRMDQIEQFTNSFISRQSNQRQSNGIAVNAVAATVTIPVVVHVVYNTSAQNISDAQIISQLNILNADFAGINSDVSLIPTTFQGVKSGNTNIQFCLAQRDPNGLSTTGIVRKSTTVTSFSSNDNVKNSTTGGSNAWDRTKYLNIWVCNLGGGLLGYAQFPGGTAATDGVVIGYTCFGNTGTAQAPFNKGRTATHEVGHWLNLRHIWGDATCGSDLVNDTPLHNTSNTGCPAAGHKSTCSGTPIEMTMNYMDYTDDACMYMFSAGQSARMNAILTTGGARASLATSNGCVPVSGTACSTPSGLASSSITTTGATVSWTAVSGASSYTLQYKTAAATTWTTVSGITTTSRALTGLTAGTVYNYQVSATCTSGTSAYSAASSFTTASSSTCGVPAGLASSSITTTGATVSWTAVSGASSYTLQYKTAAATTWTTVSGITTTSRALTGLIAGTTYNYKVSATCTSGTSAYSAASSFTTASSSTCGVPAGLASSSITTTGATVSWTAVSGASSYTLQYKTAAATTWTTVSGITTTSRALTGLIAGTTYNYKVSATCTSGTSAYSAASSFTTTSSTTTTYCASKGSSQAYEWIDLVNIGTINRTSGKETGGYLNTGLSTNLVIGSTGNTINFSAGFTSTIYTEYWRIYIDFNRDGDFVDAGETIVSGSATGSGTYFATFSVPSTVTVGSTRMRVVMSDASATTSCGTFNYGETEDYSINFTSSRLIQPTVTAADNTGTIYVFDTKQVPNESIVTKKNVTLTKDIALSVFPNPVNSSNAEIRFNLTNAGNTKVRLVDLMGRKVLESDFGYSNEGENIFTLTNLNEVSAGAYILLLDVDGKMISNKRISIVK
jgi:hypothetical protein